MARTRRPSPQATAVLLALSEDPTAWRHGYQLCQQLGLKAGSMYPILMRLADQGWLERTWESDVPPGRPRRHLYRLTPAGVEAAAGLEQAAAARGRKAQALRLRTEGGR